MTLGLTISAMPRALADAFGTIGDMLMHDAAERAERRAGDLAVDQPSPHGAIHAQAAAVRGLAPRSA